MGASELLSALAMGAKPKEVRGTFGDMAMDLHKKISAAPSKRDFFERLTKFQQGIMVAHMHARGFRWVDISSNLGIEISMVKQLIDEYSLQLGNSIMSQSLQTIVGELALRHAERYSMAMESGDYKAALAMDQAWVKIMLDLGVAERAVQRHEITHTLEGDVKSELHRMLEIERKRKFREEQRAMIERQVEETTSTGSEEV